MRLVYLTLFAAADAAASPSDWTNAEKLVGDAAAIVDPALRACSKAKTPWKIALIISPDKTGASHVDMPFPNVGVRGFTDEERCLMKAIPKIGLPPLPAEVAQITIIHTVDQQTTVPALADWRDVPNALETTFTADRRRALAACSKRAVRMMLDVRHGKTRVWLPAWQFHADTGDGTTPAAMQPIKSCLTREVARWTVPVLPADLDELELVIR